MIRSLLTIAALATAIPVAAKPQQIWYLVATNADAAYFVSDDIQREADNIVKTKSTVVSNELQPDDILTEKEVGVMRIELETIANCATRQIGMRSGTAVAEDGKILQTEPFNEPLHAVEPGSNGEDVLNFMCGLDLKRPTIRATNSTLREIGRKAIADRNTQ